MLAQLPRLALLTLTLIAILAASPAIACNGLTATITGTSGADDLDGTTGADVIDAKNGNDLVSADSGNDTVCGRGGDDTVFGGFGFDTVFGGPGDDRLFGPEAGGNYLDGGDDDDDCIGWATAVNCECLYPSCAI